MLTNWVANYLSMNTKISWIAKPQRAHPFSIIYNERASTHDNTISTKHETRFPRHTEVNGDFRPRNRTRTMCNNTRLICRQSTLFKDPQVVDQAKWAGPSSVVFTLNHECTKHGEILIKLIKIKGEITYQTKHGTTSKRHIYMRHKLRKWSPLSF